MLSNAASRSLSAIDADSQSVDGTSPGNVAGVSGGGGVMPVDGISPAIAVAASAHVKLIASTSLFIVSPLKFEDARQLAIIQITAKE
jgi:hypothetical protein